MAEHLQPSGVRGDSATDGRTVTAAEIDTVSPAGSSGGGLHVRHRGPCPDRELAAQRVDIGDPRQPAQTEHQLAGEGNASANKTRIASLWYEGGTGLLADGDYRRHLRSVTGAHNGPRMTFETPGPVDGVRGHYFRLDDYMCRADGLAELLEQVCWHVLIFAPAQGLQLPMSKFGSPDQQSGPVVPELRMTTQRRGRRSREYSVRETTRRRVVTVLDRNSPWPSRPVSELVNYPLKDGVPNPTRVRRSAPLVLCRSKTTCRQ